MSTADLASVSEGVTLLKQLIPVVASHNNYKGDPWWQSGIAPFIEFSQERGLADEETLKLVVPALPGIFGGYPFPSWNQGENAANGVLIAVFFILMVANLYIFIRNRIRGQRFYFSVGIALVCAMKVVGFACRLAWSHNILALNVGIASVVFIQVAQLVLLAMNLVLAHRIFTWRHPETGNSFWVNLCMTQIYLIVLVVIAMAILGQVLPYLYFMDHHHYNICRNVAKAAAVLNLYFASMPCQLLVLAYALPPGTVISSLGINKIIPPVHQASWIKSAGIFYFPEHDSQVFVSPPHKHTIRIMPSREPPGKGFHKAFHEPMHPESPRITVAVITVLVSSIVLVGTTCFRVAAVFHGENYGTTRPDNSVDVSYWPWHPYVQFVFYGGVEAAVIIWYLVMRVDLRFYIPEINDVIESTPKRGKMAMLNNESKTSEEDATYELESNIPHFLQIGRKAKISSSIRAPCQPVENRYIFVFI